MSGRLGIKFRRLIKVCLLITSICLVGFVLADQREAVASEDVDESRLRAATIIGILRYTEWNPPLEETIKVCVINESNVVQRLLQVVGQPLVRGKAIEMVFIDLQKRDLTDGGMCNVVLASDSSQTATILDLQTKNTLLICDECGLLSKQASIFITKQKNRIVFNVNLDQAKKNELTFRSALLELANQVRGKP